MRSVTVAGTHANPGRREKRRSHNNKDNNFVCVCANILTRCPLVVSRYDDDNDITILCYPIYYHRSGNWRDIYCRAIIYCCSAVRTAEVIGQMRVINNVIVRDAKSPTGGIRKGGARSVGFTVSHDICDIVLSAGRPSPKCTNQPVSAGRFF